MGVECGPAGRRRAVEPVLIINSQTVFERLFATERIVFSNLLITNLLTKYLKALNNNKNT